MFKKLILFMVLLCSHSVLMAQLRPTPEQREQIKRHARVNLHQEKQLTGKIVKLLYNDAYEYLDGFILETASGKAFKVDSYFYLGKALFPYLKRGEEVRITVAGDKDLLNGMMYKSEGDKRLEKSLKVTLMGLGHFKQIVSSAGSFASSEVEPFTKRDVSRYEIIKNAEISQSVKGKRKRIQLLLKNGDTINTYSSSWAKAHYEGGKVSYIRHLPPLKGMQLKSSRTFHMADSYIYGPIIPTRHDFKVSAMGQRSAFLNEASDMRFLTINTPVKGRVMRTTWLNPGGDTLRLTFSKDRKEKFEDFLAVNGKEKISLYYWEQRYSKNNYLYGLEKANTLVQLNESSFGAAQLPTTRFKFLLNKFNEIKNTPIVAEGTIKKYLTTNQGTYAGLRLENNAGEEQIFRFLGTHGQDIMGAFKVGDRVELTAQKISAGDLHKVRFRNERVGMQGFLNAPGYTSTLFADGQTWVTFLVDEDKKGRNKNIGLYSTKSPYISRMVGSGKQLDLDTDTENQQTSLLPSELAIDVEITKISKKKRRYTFYMKNGDTLNMRSDKGYKEGEKVSYLQKFPQVLKGQVNKNPLYAETPLRTTIVKKRQLTGALEPIYDDWMRLMGYQAEVEGKNGRVRISSDLGKRVSSFVSEYGNQPMTLFCNELVSSKETAVYYFFTGIQSDSGDLIYDNQVRQPQYYEADTVFNTKVKEVIQHSDLYTFSNTTVILENDFVFSISNRTLGSIGASAIVGAEITVRGKPLVPREGEVLKNKDYRLIKPSQITAGSIEFKISD